jgi:hypothetical protein
MAKVAAGLRKAVTAPVYSVLPGDPSGAGRGIGDILMILS